MSNWLSWSFYNRWYKNLEIKREMNIFFRGENSHKVLFNKKNSNVAYTNRLTMWKEKRKFFYTTNEIFKLNWETEGLVIDYCQIMNNATKWVHMNMYDVMN